MKNQLLCKILSIGILLCAGILPYAHTVSFPFHADSITLIAENPNIRKPFDISVLSHAFPTPARIVTFWTFALNYSWGGVEPAGYHWVNIGIHTLNGLALWALILLMFQSPRLIEDELRGQRHAVALFAALIFLTHPLQSQAVSYVIQRGTLLATFFYFLTLIFYLKARLSERSGLSFFMAAVTALLAMFSKEVAFTLPLMVILLEFYLLKSGKYSLGAQKSFHFSHLVVITLYLLIIPGLYHFDYENILGSEILSRSHDATIEFISPGRYFISQFEVLTIYLQKFLLPVRLSFDYDLSTATKLEGRGLWGLIVFGVMTIGAVMVYGRSVLTTIGVLGFFAMLSVESTIIPLGDLILEHRMYLPLAGLALAFVAWCYASPKRAIVMHLTFLVVVGGLAYGTYQRNMVYQSRISLWKDVTVQFPNKGRGLVGLANAYLDEGDVLRGMKNCREALRVNPNNAAAYLALGRIHRDLDNHKLALFYFTKAATLEPWRNDYLYEQGVALRQQGAFQSALDVFNKIIHSAPRMARAYSQRGGIYESRGETLLALADYNKALEYNPYDIEAYNQRGWFHIEQENFKDGVIDFNKMIDLQPRSVVAYNNRGLSLLRMKQYALALKDLNTAVSFGPQIGQLYVNRGQVHEELKNWRQAREDYLRAIELNPQDPAGYIQIGLLDMKFRNFEVALRRLDQAVDLQPDASHTRYHRALLYYATERYAEAYQDLMAANRAGYAPAKDFLPKVTPQISTPLTEKP